MAITVQTQARIIFDTIAERDGASYTPSGSHCFVTATNKGYIKIGGSWISATKKGGVPLTGTPSGKYLKDDGTWAVSGGGTPSSGVTDETTFGISPNAGSSSTYSRGDHTHGTPANPITSHESTYNHTLLHANTNDPTTDQKNALAGTSGTPSGTNKYVTDADARNTNARTPTTHNVAGSEHNADTLANLNSKISDADVIALAGQIGGTAASPDVRGIRETGGPTLLTTGAIVDGEYLKRSGSTLISGTPGGGATPAWKGNIVTAWGDGDPSPVLRHMQAVGVISPTPTNITSTVARISYF